MCTDVKYCDRYRMKKLGNVRSIFKVDRNLDFHLRIDDEAAAEAKVEENTGSNGYWSI